MDEIELMKKIAAGSNTHVVRMVGCVVMSEPFHLVTEFIAHGNLLRYMQSIRTMVSTNIAQIIMGLYKTD